MIEQFYSSYEQDDFTGNISPVIVHYHSNSNQHTIILVGRTTDYYLALDPAKGKKLVKVHFASDGRVQGEVTFSNYSSYVDAVQQYQRIN